MNDVSFIITARPERSSLLVCLSSIMIQKTPEDEICVVPINGMNWYTQINRAVDLVKNDWLCFPNDDCYYMPTFRNEFSRHMNKSDFIYSNIVYDGRNRGPYGILPTRPKVNFIDKICYMVRTSIFKELEGFPVYTEVKDLYRTDGYFVENVVASGYTVTKIEDILAVHN